MAKEKPNLVEELKTLTTELLEKIGIDADVVVEESKDEKTGERTLSVAINSESETGLLIGTHGSTLNAIQVFLAMAVRQLVDEWVRVVVNIGDWKEKQEEHLAGLATQAVERAIATGQAQRLYNLNSAQRRIIHMQLAENTDVVTQSEGEGEERHLVIVPKNA